MLYIDELTSVLSGLFSGFGLYSVCYALFAGIPRFGKKPALSGFDRTAVVLFAILGILYLLSFSLDILLNFSSLKDAELASYKYRIMSSPYWYGFWTQAFIYLAITQFMWIRRIARNRIFRFLIAPFAIIPIEVFTIYTTSLHREFISSSWHFDSIGLIWVIAFYLFIFLLLTGAVYLTSRFFRK